MMRATPDDLASMAVFARVVEARSFSDAARSLGLSKSSVSARISKLEERLGVRLLHRTTRRLALTPDGVRFYERCARVVEEADGAAEIAAGASAVPRGVLRVHAASSFAEAHLAEPIGEFRLAYPDVRIELRLGDRFPDPAAEDFDVAIVTARTLPDSALSARKLATDRLVVCASPAYLRRRGIPFRPAELVHHECLSHGAARRAEEWYFETEEGPVSLTSSASVVAEDAGFLRSAALAGVGIAILPFHLVGLDLARGALRRVLAGFLDVAIGVHALHPHGRLAPASVRAFVDHLVARFHRAPWTEGPRRDASSGPKRTKAGAIPMTEQDIERLTEVAALYEESDPPGAARLRDALAEAKSTPPKKVPRAVVTMNSRVLCRDASGHERELSLVYPWDAADAATAAGDRVAVTSSLGRLLLGARVGETVDDAGHSLSILALPYQPEAAGDHHL